MDTIKSGKMTILEIFKDNWFNIPDYQRQYSWNEELVETLLDDIKEAMNYSDREYFLGSFVYTYKNNKEEWELLDGQQNYYDIFNSCLFKRYLWFANSRYCINSTRSYISNRE